MFRSLAQGWGRSIGRRVAEQAVDDFIQSDDFAKIVEDVVTEELKKPRYAFFWFIKEMQREMMRVDKTLSGKRAFELAASTYRQYLADEKISFGDVRFDWTKDGARDVIHSYEIEHWESAP